MVINIDLLDGATVLHKGIFYVSSVNDNKVDIRELFTGLKADSSLIEHDVMTAILEGIKEQTN
jgi:hypothetical protein